MEETPEKKLYDAAAEGNATIFRQLLQQHPFLLDKVSFACTRKTPLHMAAAKGYEEIASILLAEAPKMCWSRDSGGMNPIHVAAMNGHADVLEKLVEKEPFAAMEKLDRGETALHLCVKHRQLRALKVLVEKLADDFVCAEDDDGETVLHLAVRFRQVQMIQFLVDKSKIDKKSKNSKGQSPLGVLKQSIFYNGSDKTSKEIKELLKKYRPATAVSYQTPPAEWLAKKRDSMMVVAILIATMAFQAAISPPGGVWQDNEKATASMQNNNTLLRLHRAGEAVIAFRRGDDNNPEQTYNTFMRYNTVAFVTSLSTILLLMTGLPFRHKFLVWALVVIMWTSLMSVGMTFAYAIKAVTPKDEWNTHTDCIKTGILAWGGVMTAVLIANSLWLLTRWLEDLGVRLWPPRNCVNKPPSP